MLTFWYNQHRHNKNERVKTTKGQFLAGDNNVAVSDTEDVSVAAISDALFGTWSGVITYEDSIVDAE